MEAWTAVPRAKAVVAITLKTIVADTTLAREEALLLLEVVGCLRLREVLIF